MKFKYLPFFLFFLPLISCNNVEEKKVDLPKKEVFLDQNEIIDEELKILYRVPQNWNEMPASLSDKKVGRVTQNGEDEFVIYTPKTYYYNKNSGALLRVGAINFNNNVQSDSLTISYYIQNFGKYNRNFDIEISELQNSKFSIKQLKIIKNDLVSFKFIFQNQTRNIIQFDFSFKIKDLSMIYPTIVSAINSISLI